MTTPTIPPQGKLTQVKPEQDKPAGKRGRKPGAKPREWDYTGLTLDVLSKPAEVGADLASMTAPTRARDERQVQIDKIVAGLYKEWTNEGKPERWAQMPKKSYHVDPKAADTLRMLVRRAANFLGYAVKFGRPVHDQHGREIVTFGVRDQRQRSKSAEGTFTMDELREFAVSYFAEDPEAVEDFLTALAGPLEDEPDGDAGE